MKLAVSPVPGVDVAPTVEKFAFGGLPAVPSYGGGLLPLGLGEVPGVHVAAITGALAASRVARWTLKVSMEFTKGVVKVNRTSSVAGPASKLPTAALRSVGASAPRLMQMLKVDVPPGLGS